jgi:hypothetical protein
MTEESESDYFSPRTTTKLLTATPMHPPVSSSYTHGRQSVHRE